MSVNLTLEYWKDDGWFVGRIREMPGVFSQGATLEELEVNIKDAYHLVQDKQKVDLTPPNVPTGVGTLHL